MGVIPDWNGGGGLVYKSKTKILITGVGGLIGLKLLFSFDPDKYDVIGRGREHLDVTDFKQCKRVIWDIRPDIIIHCAAYTSVDKAEVEQDKVNLINIHGTRNIAVCCSYLEIPMLYFSTAAVFDGKKNSPYSIWDETNPISTYARTKLAAENEIKMLLNKFYIMRIIHVYGSNRSDFVTQTISKLRNTDKPDITLIDQVLNVTHVDDICRAAVDLIESGRYGVYHYSSKGEATRHGITKFIADCLGKTDYTISQYDVKSAARPFYTIMDTKEIETVLKQPIPTWQESLKEFIDEHQTTTQ